MTDATSVRFHAVVALSLLETMQALDTPQQDDPEEVQRELVTKRLGTSRTVAQQISRYRALAHNGGSVAAPDIASLLTLCSRRADADLLYADAGRLAASHLLARPSPARSLHHAIPGMVGSGLAFRAVRRLASDALALEVTMRVMAVRAVPSFARDSTPWAGKPCVFFGAALGWLLTELTGFSGAVLHERCEHTGAKRCVWSTDTLGEDDET